MSNMQRSVLQIVEQLQPVPMTPLYTKKASMPIQSSNKDNYVNLRLNHPQYHHHLIPTSPHPVPPRLAL